MGKQVNFYAVPDDINALIEFVVTKKGGVLSFTSGWDW